MSQNRHMCAEIQYLHEAKGLLHSDLCWDGELTDELKDFLKHAFSEFLQNWDEENGYFVVNPLGWLEE